QHHSLTFHTEHVRVPFMLLGDSAFAFTDYCIRLCGGDPERHNQSQRKFNERHSRVRRVVERAFGIFSAKFRVLRKAMELEPGIAS
uniref:DDE Tnp4 domain-containing protein n=1 Tax=Anopheles coluzzii TaxID=1518534 RepID=A0A6E8W8A3_ANOCL